MSMILACRESGWMDQITDFRQWDNLCRSFGIELELVDDLYQPTGVVVVLDETGEVELADFEHTDDCTYVFGRSCMNRIQDRIRHDFAVRVDMPGYFSPFGVSVAGIVLHDRMSKWRQR